MKAEYPKVLFHATADAIVVADPVAHEAAGPEWAESPDDAVQIAALKAEADAKPKKAAK